MKNLLRFASLFILSASIYTQNDLCVVEGTITDVNGPVAGISVSITRIGEEKPTRTTITDENGSYRLSVHPGQFFLQAKRVIGRLTFLSGQNSVEAVSGGRLIVDFKIPPVSTIRELVTVSVGENQTVDEVSKTVNVIGAQEMRERADFTLADTLRTTPGFRVQQLGGFGRTASIKTRGLRNQDTAILIDGIRFRDASAITGDASPFLSDFTLTSVNKIEVLRGSGSSLYGTNAIGGTVDFQTPKPQSGIHGQASGAFGGLGLGRFRGNISDATKDGKLGFNLGISRTAYTKGIDGQDNASNTNFQSRIEFNPFSKTNISGRFFTSNAKVRLNSSPDTFGPLPASNSTIIDANPNVNFISDANDPDSFQKSRFVSGQLAVTQILNNGLILSGYYQGLTTKRTNDNGDLGSGFQSASTSIFDGTINTGNVHLTWAPEGENSMTAGYEFEKENFGNDGFTPSSTADFFTRASQFSNTFYVQDMVSLLDASLQLAGGFRIQSFGLKDPAFSLTNAPYNNLSLSNPPTAYTFDGAASYFIARTGTKLRAHAGNGYRVPSLYERFGTFFSTFPSASFVAIGDPLIKPEKTIAFDAGIEQNLAKNRLRLTATYFYTKLTDIIGYGNVVPDIGTTPRPFGGYENQKAGIARGAEFSASLKPTRSTDIFASYTFTNSDQRTPQVSGSRILTTLGIPDHQFTLVATQRFERFWVNFDFLASSNYLAPIFSNSTFNTYIYRFKGNRRGDLTAGYTFALNKDKLGLKLFGTLENMFDDKYYENGFKTAGINGRVGVAVQF